MNITKETMISELLNLEEDLTDVFEKHGLYCVGCPGSYTENLEDAAEGHGVNVEELIADLNEMVNKDHK